MVQFLQCTCKLVNGNSEPVSEKPVVFKDNLNVWVTIFGKSIKPEEIGIQKNVRSVNSLQNIIEIVNTVYTG